VASSNIIFVGSAEGPGHCRPEAEGRSGEALWKKDIQFILMQL
jgi:hypothetical protein